MQVTYGTVCPEGHLPVYSVDTEEEAQQLIVLACGTDMHGNYYARELVEEQTLENLAAFGDRLDKAYQWLKRKPPA